MPIPRSLLSFLARLSLLALAALARLPAQTEGAQRWAFATVSPASAVGNILSSPAEGPDGTIYIGVEVGSSSSTSPSGFVRAIRPDGSLKWSFATTDWVDSTPAVGADGTVYFGCWDGNVYAIQASGTKKWSIAVGSYVSSSPAIAADGTIYVGTGNGTLVAINANGTLKWTFPTADWIESSPVVASDGTVYFGSWDNNVYAVRADGTEKWRYTTGGDVVGSAAIAADGTVYIGSRDLLLYAFTPNGVLKWSVDLSDTIESSPAVGADETIYVTTTGGRIFALASDGSERWRYPAASQTALNSIYSSPALRSDGTVVFGSSDNAIYALKPDGTLRWKATLGDWADSSPLIASDGTIYIGCSDKKLYSFYGNGQTLDSAAPWPAFRRTGTRQGRAARITIATAPISQGVSAGGSVTLTAAGTTVDGGPALSYQWQRDGANIPGATDASLTLSNFQPADAGLYAATIGNSAASATTDAAILGVASSTKIVGAAEEFASDIKHPNGKFYDQVLLNGAAASVRADAGQTTRTSYVDLNDDIVQVEFTGAGTLSLTLENPSGPALPVHYNQEISYMKGHARLTIVGADASTYVAVFSVGKANAINQSLFKSDVTYDGVAQIASIAIQSVDGKFGGIFAGNATAVDTRGLVGIYAPGVQFGTRIALEDINAADAATPVFQIGATVGDTLITGGDFAQDNAASVKVSGLTRLEFVAGGTSAGATLLAQKIQAQLEQNGVNVTSQVVVNPSP